MNILLFYLSMPPLILSPINKMTLNCEFVVRMELQCHKWGLGFNSYKFFIFSGQFQINLQANNCDF